MNKFDNMPKEIKAIIAKGFKSLTPGNAKIFADWFNKKDK